MEENTSSKTTLSHLFERYSRVLVVAPGIHSGGGLAVFRQLLKFLPESKTVILADERMPENFGETLRFRHSLRDRFAIEYWLKSNARNGDFVLFFSNLPPLFSIKGHKVLFLQNRLLLEDKWVSGYPRRVLMRMTVEKFWLDRFIGNVNEVWVQTKHMAEKLGKKLKDDSKKVSLVHFLHESLREGLSSITPQLENKKYDFVYVASADAHKNHKNLLKAWQILKKNKTMVSLALTLDPNSSNSIVKDLYTTQQREGLDIHFVGEVSPTELKAIYSASKYLIFPSLCESLGLPLLEAQGHGLSILASNRDFVKEVAPHASVFDPEDPESIASSVMSQLNTQGVAEC